VCLWIWCLMLRRLSLSPSSGVDVMTIMPTCCFCIQNKLSPGPSFTAELAVWAESDSVVFSSRRHQFVSCHSPCSLSWRLPYDFFIALVLSCLWLGAVNLHVVCRGTGHHLLTANCSLCDTCRGSQQLTVCINAVCKHDTHHISP
jgi:hypothetical protein